MTKENEKEYTAIVSRVQKIELTFTSSSLEQAKEDAFTLAGDDDWTDDVNDENDNSTYQLVSIEEKK